MAYLFSAILGKRVVQLTEAVTGITACCSADVIVPAMDGHITLFRTNQTGSEMLISDTTRSVTWEQFLTPPIHKADTNLKKSAAGRGSRKLSIKRGLIL